MVLRSPVENRGKKKKNLFSDCYMQKKINRLLEHGQEPPVGPQQHIYLCFGKLH